MSKPSRKKQAGTPRLERVPVNKMERPQDGDYDTAKWALGERMRLNLSRTGHPLHHMTADGTIVEPDPLIETLRTHVSPDEWPPVPDPWPDAPPAVPVIRDWYEREPGRTWVKQWLESQR